MRTILVALAGLTAVALVARPAHAAVFSPAQSAISVGGGYGDFVNSGVRNITSGQGVWDARLLLGTRSPLAIEAAYTGTAGSEQDPIAPNPTMSTTQVTGTGRVNIVPKSRFQPFVLGGVGWVNMHSYGRDTAPIAAERFEHNNNGVVVPVGGGFAGYIGKHGMVDVRGTYNFLTNVRDFTNQNARPDMWMATLRAGYAF